MIQYFVWLVGTHACMFMRASTRPNATQHTHITPGRQLMMIITIMLYGKLMAILLLGIKLNSGTVGVCCMRMPIVDCWLLLHMKIPSLKRCSMRYFFFLASSAAFIILVFRSIRIDVHFQNYAGFFSVSAQFETSHLLFARHPTDSFSHFIHLEQILFGIVDR